MLSLLLWLLLLLSPPLLPALADLFFLGAAANAKVLLLVVWFVLCFKLLLQLAVGAMEGAAGAGLVVVSVVEVVLVVGSCTATPLPSSGLLVVGGFSFSMMIV